MPSVGSGSSLDDLSSDDTWETELEIALLKNADLSEIRSICQFRPVPSHLRRDFWRSCLPFKTSSIGMSNFSEIYDLPSQEELHKACESAADDVLTRISQLSNDSSHPPPSAVQLTSDFESVLTHFAQTYSLPFSSDNSWVPILTNLYLVLRPVDRSDLFAYFVAVYHRFIASGPQGSANTCNTFRLLLQYHEPELCNFLDSHKLGPECYAKAWFDSLYAGHLSDEALPAMWDICFLLGEPQFGMMVALVLLVNAKDSLMQKAKEIGKEATELDEGGDETFSLGESDDEDNGSEGSSDTAKPKTRDELLVELRGLPRPMQPTDLRALVDITRVYARKTPSSFRTSYLPLLFGSPSPDNAPHLISGALALLVSVEEVLSAQAARASALPRLPRADLEEEEEEAEEEEEGVRFLLVDCRPAEQYNAGHLATAFYLDTELMLSNPPEFNTSVQALLQTQQRGIATGSRAVGEHIVFMGSGRPAEDRVTQMVIAHFLRLNTPLVSMVDGGYAAFHEALSPPEANRDRLVSHEPDLCFVCAANRGQRALRLAAEAAATANQRPPLTTSSNSPRSAPIPPPSSVLSKFSNLLQLKKTPPAPPLPANQQPAPPSQNAKPKAYRNTSAVFGIDDNDEDEEDLDEDDISPRLLSAHPPPPSSTQRGFLGMRLVPSRTQQPNVVTNLESCHPGELISLQTCRSMPGVLTSFDCTLIGHDDLPAFRAVILVLEKFMIVVREREKQLLAALGSFMQKAFVKRVSAAAAAAEEPEKELDGMVEVVFPISQMTKITSKKITPEIITFHCTKVGEDLITESSESVRLHIPQAGDAVKVIKNAVFSSNGIS